VEHGRSNPAVRNPHNPRYGKQSRKRSLQNPFSLNQNELKGDIA
jgi:hypothetical protein